MEEQLHVLVYTKVAVQTDAQGLGAALYLCCCLDLISLLSESCLLN